MKTLSRIFLSLPVLAFLAASSPASAAEPARPRPNILFIYTDDHSHRAFWADCANAPSTAGSGP